ncbi:hypothetical protein IHE44_0002919 [Lamprotornis superbus]|uniref:Uncharacterized protein n=1 Tax=Lamprotornis superbus TaxID=245042 RepID=A0A835NE86_9PASS|nr:hypothetical protein IHE44_0002919 [Lamprotornis superbus]
MGTERPRLRRAEHGARCARGPPEPGGGTGSGSGGRTGAARPRARSQEGGKGAAG